MMTSLLQAFILGAVQGITEWLPISSEGINTLILVQFFDKPLSTSIQMSLWLHCGTLLAAIIFFRRDIIELSRHLPQYVKELRASNASERTALINFLALTTLVSAVPGVPLLFFSLNLKTMPAALSTAIIGAFLIITGLVQKFALKSAGRKIITTTKDAIVVGIVQALSVLPGFSRSGLTVSAMLFRGYSAKQAVRLSFLMSIPVVLATVIFTSVANQSSFNLPVVVSMVTAFLFGWLTIGALLKMAERIPFWAFCLVVGGLSLLPLLIETVII